MPMASRAIALLLLSSLCACGPALRPGDDRLELLRLHAVERQAHLEKRASLLGTILSDRYRNISRGRVTQPSRLEEEKKFQEYFDRSTFLLWDDIAPPIIRVSPDGQMAYVIVQKDVRLTAPDSSGTVVEEHTVFAWLETYEKEEGKWRLTAIASTDRPGSRRSN